MHINPSRYQCTRTTVLDTGQQRLPVDDDREIARVLTVTYLLDGRQIDQSSYRDMSSLQLEVHSKIPRHPTWSLFVTILYSQPMPR
jgi:hypothetical protein